MQLKIQNGVVELSGQPILNDINIEINDNSHIAIVGRNGCGKTTLLKLISGEYALAKNEACDNSFFALSGDAKIGVLSQITFKDDNVTLVDEIRSAYEEILNLKSKLDQAQKTMEQSGLEEDIKEYTNLLDTFTNLGGFYFEKEYEAAIKKFGFSQEEKYKKISEFSGGERTKIAFLKLLLSKPEILLLDEPTNHLDIEATLWLEEYLKDYKKAFVVVSHDRMFIDNIAKEVYEIEYGKTTRYVGNYSNFVEAKKLNRKQQLKDFKAQQKEIKHLEELVDKFRYKATKAAMAQSKIKQLERMTPIDSPQAYDNRTFHADFQPVDLGVKDMLDIKDLTVGYHKALSKINLQVKQGEKIGIIGGNGLGKSTFIKTLMGEIPQISGSFKFSPRASVGYFDQQMAQYSSNKTVLDDFLSFNTSLTNFEARSALGAFMFSGDDVFKRVNMLSGGERVRLALCKIFQKKPNFLILDEPTNHLDIVGKETLEEILSSYAGTLIFVSHDRYFVKKIAESLLVFEPDGVKLYPYGYNQYINSKKEVCVNADTVSSPKPKKSYTTPAKEKAKRERAVKKAEEKIALLESRLSEISQLMSLEEIFTDYQKLSQLQDEQAVLEADLDNTMSQWESLCQELSDLDINIK
ncbi:MAG: ABC-F type ribosomal protection protein [Clostridia bacterium]|nr:ABC-F type ribosomal protection protein [Clostridia bacterium]